jgi:stearoyl-CoA desaturase (delta-9 desaturase)
MSAVTGLDRPAVRQWGAIHWPYLVPILSVHLLALLAFVPWLFSWIGVIAMFAGVHLFGTFGINLCYHRLLTHRSLAVPKWLEHFFATIALCCLQDTPIRWVATHRLHHTHSDDSSDPHTPHDGFFWCHMGWLFRRNPALRSLSFYEKYARDLLGDSYYLFLERHPATIVWVYLAQTVVYYLAGFGLGWLAAGNVLAGVQLGLSLVVWGVFARTVFTWHITWSVNSLTHCFGYRNYATDEGSRNNWFVAMVAAGEGWHNNHHHDPASASVQHRWWEIDLTYYTIAVLEWLGLAQSVIRPRHRRQGPAAPLPTRKPV